MSYSLLITSDDVRRLLMKTKLKSVIVTTKDVSGPLYILDVSENAVMKPPPEVVADVIHDILSKRKIKVVFFDGLNSLARLYRYVGNFSSSDSSYNFVEEPMFEQRPLEKKARQASKAASKRDRDDNNEEHHGGGAAVAGVLALGLALGIIGFAAAANSRDDD